MDNREGRLQHGADIHAVKAENVYIFRDLQTLLSGCSKEPHGDIMVGGKYSGGAIFQLHEGAKAKVTGGKVILLTDHQLIVIKNSPIGQGTEITDLSLLGGKHRFGAADHCHTAVPLIDQMADSCIGCFRIVDQHCISGKALEGAVQLHNRNFPGSSEFIKLVQRKIFRGVDQPVNTGGQKEAQIITLETVVGAVAGNQAVVAVFAKHFVQGGEDIAEEGGGDIRQQNSNAAVTLGLQASGEGIDPVIQRSNGIPDGSRIFRTKIAARKAAVGKEYLSFYYVEALSYEIVE